jgi:hypothetical protein
MAEVGRGWLPNNVWLTQQLTADLNINNNCNATWSGGEVNFYTSGGGCRNTGEIAAIFDHEWGHGLDDNDANGQISSSGEAYADIVAIYRLHASCVGHGFRHTSDQGCGQTADGTGYNADEGQTQDHCATDCSGARDTDWMKHEDQTPDTPQNFVCTSCFSGGAPCGSQNHCGAAPTRQAAWDFAARDLQSLPYNYDHNTAFVVANKIFYHGSGNIGAWHACSCPNASDGCGASNGYMQWLAADDDNGNLADGTPHMTALYAAFDRHNIACDDPAPQIGGCAGAPDTAPTVTSTSSTDSITLEWEAVPDAVEYRVFRTEGHAGCEFGKLLLDTVGDTTYTDSGMAEGRDYHYVVQAVGTTGECFSPVSECLTTQAGGPALAIQSTSVADSCLAGGDGDGNNVADPGEDIVLTALLRNVGPTPSTGITATLTSTTPGAIVTQGATTYPDLGPGESSASNGTGFSFTIDGDQPCGASIFFDLNAQANEGSWTNVVHVRLASDFAGQCDECVVASPGPVSGLGWPTTVQNIEWGEAETTAYYRLYRGVPQDLPNLLDFGDDSCLRMTTLEPATGEAITEVPPSGSFYWYLVTSGNSAGESAAGNATAGPRVRNGSEVCP